MIPLNGKKSIAADAVRFLAAGAANTIMTLVIYQSLLLVVPPSFAYAVAWLAGILFVMVVYPSRVFADGRTGAADRFLIGCCYVVIFLLGLLLLQLLNSASLHPSASIFLVIGFTTAIGFLGGRFFLRRDSS